MASFNIGKARTALMRWELGLASAYFAVFAFLILNGLISNHAIGRARESETELLASLDARLAAETLLSTLKDAETGQRGYLLTGNEESLAPYHQALSRYEDDLGRLRSSVVRMKLDRPHMIVLELAVRDRIKALAEMLSARKAFPDRPVDLTQERDGRQIMDRVRAEVETLKNKISVRVSELTQASQSNSASASRTNIASTLVGVVVSTIAFIFATTLIRRRLDIHRLRARSTRDLERQVQLRTAELKRANDEMEAFSYSVSHDLRAPLRAISGHAAILEEDYHDKLDDEGKQAIDRIKASCRKMSDLIDDLLTLSRSTRGEMSLETIDLSAIVKDILDDVQQSSKRPSVKIEIEPGVTAMGDKRLTRVLMENLLRNAWKFTGKKEATEIHFGQAPPEEGVKVYFVRDNGVGFDEQYAAQIFLPFQRLHRDQDFEGSGIGLAIVQRIVERHGGRIWAVGKPEEGATFYFTLEPAEPVADTA